FDATLSPVVEISELGGVTGCSDRVVATFTTTTGPTLETVRVDLVNQLYIVNWHTKAFNLNSACTYRIRFLVAELQLGIADVDVVDNGAQLKRVDTDQFVPLLDDGTLPIKARVEFGAVTFALTGDATACRPGRDCAEAVVTPVPGQDVTVLTTAQTAGLVIPRVALPDQVVVLSNTRPDAPARFLPCDPNFGTTPPVGASGVLLWGWRVAMNSLHALVGTRMAYASTSVVHEGLGGSTCCTSYFTWGLPAVLTANGA